MCHQVVSKFEAKSLVPSVKQTFSNIPVNHLSYIIIFATPIKLFMVSDNLDETGN